jgi:hypothetical protein
MDSVSQIDMDGKKEACKTYIEQTKLLVTLASAFLVAPAALVTILNGKDATDLDECEIIWFLSIEILFIFSVLSGYCVLGSLAGSQDQGSFDVFRTATRWLSLLQFVSYILGIFVFVMLTLHLVQV